MIHGARELSERAGDLVDGDGWSEWELRRLDMPPSSLGEPIERCPGVGGESRHITLDDIPHDIETEPVIRVPQAVAHPADLVPRLVGHQRFGLIAQTDGGFANPL